MARVAAAVAVAAAASSAAIIPDGACQPCDVATTCDTVACKIPKIAAELPTGTGLEQGLDNATKTAFERAVGHGLRDSAAVQWMTEEYAIRLLRFLEAAAPGENTSTVLADAFTLPWADWKQNAGYTGYVGPDVDAIRTALRTGNLRERWGLIYVMTKAGGFSNAIRPLADAAAAMKDSSNLTRLGLNADAVLVRRDLVAQTEACSPACKYSAVKDFAFESFNSWVRFDFGVAKHWNGSRENYPTCGLTGWMTNDPSIVPPLSPAEIALQCNGTGPCALQWCQGDNAEYVVENPFKAGVPGYAKRAEALGYRMVAGPSGTTSNVMQVGLQLGFTTEELGLLRLTMAAWMLATNDHSLLEILLGGDNYLPATWNTAFELGDIAKLMPTDVTTSHGRKFHSADVWAAVAAKLSKKDEAAVCSAFGAEQLHYLQSLNKGICA